MYNIYAQLSPVLNLGILCVWWWRCGVCTQADGDGGRTAEPGGGDAASDGKTQDKPLSVTEKQRVLETPQYPQCVLPERAAEKTQVRRETQIWPQKYQCGPCYNLKERHKDSQKHHNGGLFNHQLNQSSCFIPCRMHCQLVNLLFLTQPKLGHQVKIG